MDIIGATKKADSEHAIRSSKQTHNITYLEGYEFSYPSSKCDDSRDKQKDQR